MNAIGKDTMPANPSAAVPNRIFADHELVAARYRVVRLIGTGGTGEVYEVVDVALGSETVALKALYPIETADAIGLERFRREILLSRKVTHPNVCRIFDLGEHLKAGGARTLFLTMELLRGVSLSDRLDAHHAMPVDRILPTATQIAAGLAAAHEAGIVHRDLKPGNIMLLPPPGDSGPEKVVITDFGLARSETVGNSGITASGEIVGTPVYMSPEQVQAGPVSVATDVYSFGVVLYEMLTGHVPFDDVTPLATALKRLSAPPTPIRTWVNDVDPIWEATIDRCLAIDPADRFQSAAQVVAALRGEISPHPSKASPGAKLRAMLKRKP
jgi:serine/threonine protein kinase